MIVIFKAVGLVIWGFLTRQYNRVHSWAEAKVAGQSSDVFNSYLDILIGAVSNVGLSVVEILDEEAIEGAIGRLTLTNVPNLYVFNILRVDDDTSVSTPMIFEEVIQ